MRSSDGFFYEGEVFYPFQDMLFNALLTFTFMFLVAFMMVNPPETDKKIESKAEFLITATWPDNHPDDIDLYVMDPRGDTVWYFQKEFGLIHLDRDDRGNYRDTVAMGPEKVKLQSPLNQETVTVRGIMPGEYVVNIHQYLATGVEPVPVSVTVEKLNPVVQLVWYETVMMEKKNEKTVIRFTLDDSGTVTKTSAEPKRLTKAR